MRIDAATMPAAHSLEGSVILRQGFRLFFPAAGAWALVAVALWLPAYLGIVSTPTAFNPLAWHAHEMIFGFVPAAIAGFLLAAMPNWTGRRPIQGLAVVILLMLWLAGRAAVGTSALIGAGTAAAVDLAFLASLLGTVLREIVAARNWRNLPVTAALGALLAANLLTHLEATGLAATAAAGQRLGIAVVAFLISMIGGRVIPSFTWTWLRERGDTRTMPAVYGALDRASLVILGAALAVWVAFPHGLATGAGLVLAAGLAFIRQARWRGHRTMGQPLVWSLHLGFGWVAVGLLLLGVGGLTPAVPATAGLHALTVGAIGSMTLAVMTRATLGHTGRPLAADRWTAAIYVLVAAAAALRIAAPFLPASHLPLLWASAVAWIAAFGMFTVRFGRLALSSDRRA